MFSQYKSALRPTFMTKFTLIKESNQLKISQFRAFSSRRKHLMRSRYHAVSYRPLEQFKYLFNDEIREKLKKQKKLESIERAKTITASE